MPTNVVVRQLITDYETLLKRQLVNTFYGFGGCCYTRLHEMLENLLAAKIELGFVHVPRTVDELLSVWGYEPCEVRAFHKLALSHEKSECPGFCKDMNLTRAMEGRWSIPDSKQDVTV